jgi:hypothetical protein
MIFLLLPKTLRPTWNNYQEIYVIKDPKVPDSYLGANYIGDPQENWSITAKKYIKEALSQIEKHLGIML